MKQFRPYKLFQSITMLFFAILCFSLALYISHLNLPKVQNVYLTFLFICILIVFIINFICILLDLSLFQKMSLDYFDINKIAYLDQLTGKSNRFSFDLLLKDFATSDELPEIGCISFSLINLPSINETKGYQQGDEIIRDFAEMLNEVSDNFGIFGRNSGNEFIVVIRECNLEKINALLKELNIQVYGHNTLLNYQGINYRYGYVLNCEEHYGTISQIISSSIQKMQNNKDCQ